MEEGNVAVEVELKSEGERGWVRSGCTGLP